MKASGPTAFLANVQIDKLRECYSDRIPGRQTSDSPSHFPELGLPRRALSRHLQGLVVTHGPPGFPQLRPPVPESWMYSYVVLARVPPAPAPKFPQLQEPSSPCLRSQTKVPKRQIPSENCQTEYSKRKFQSEKLQAEAVERKLPSDIFQTNYRKRKFPSERYQTKVVKRKLPSESYQSKVPKLEFTS